MQRQTGHDTTHIQGQNVEMEQSDEASIERQNTFRTASNAVKLSDLPPEDTKNVHNIIKTCER